MKKILLAQKDHFLLNVYANSLRSSGFGVTVVTDKKNIVNRILKFKPDLLILDTNFSEVLWDLRRDQELWGLKVATLSDFSETALAEFGVIKNFAKAKYSSGALVSEITKLLS